MDPTSSSSLISIIVPVRNEPELATWLLRLCLRFPGVEVVLVDTSPTPSIRRAPSPLVRILHRPELKTRAEAMNEGARSGTGSVFIFLHADCELPVGALETIAREVADGVRAGAFLKEYAGGSFLMPLWEGLLNRLASRGYGLVGTNAIFLHRELFLGLGGYPVVPILEDVLLVDRIPRVHKMRALPLKVTVSSRRYRAFGGLARMTRNTLIYLGFRIFRIPPKLLAHIY